MDGWIRSAIWVNRSELRYTGTEDPGIGKKIRGDHQVGKAAFLKNRSFQFMANRQLIFDFGPSKRSYDKGRIIDLSRRAFLQIADLKEGIINVTVEEVSE